MKKVMINLALDILAIATVLLDLFVCNIPKWIGLAGILVIILTSVWTWVNKTGKTGGKIVLTILNVLAVLVVFVGTFCNPYRNSIWFRSNADYTCKAFGTVLTYDEAKRDLDCAMQHLEAVHPLFLHGLTEDMEERYAQALENLESYDTITVNVLWREIEQIFSSMGDGHTAVYANYPDYHYLKYDYEHRENGEELVGINALTLEELFEEKSSLFSYESEAYGLASMKNYLYTSEDLDYLGISLENGVTYTYRTPDGQTADCIYYEEDFVTYDEYLSFNNLTDGQSAEGADDFVSYEILPEYDLAVLTLDSCEYNSEYKDCVEKLFREVKEKGINNVCVDLRNNGGGNSLVADEFIHYLDTDTYKSWGQDWRLGLFLISSEGSTMQNEGNQDLRFGGEVYVLTSVYTFSSAMDFAMLIKDNDLGTIVGEASGNLPGGYGDISVFKLPNSGLVMQVSTKKWYRVDTENPDEFIEPDIPCDSDTALEVLERMLAK